MSPPRMQVVAVVSDRIIRISRHYPVECSDFLGEIAWGCVDLAQKAHGLCGDEP